MIKTRIDAFRVAHGVGLKGSNYAQDLKDLIEHGTPTTDSIVVKSESAKVSGLIIRNLGTGRVYGTSGDCKDCGKTDSAMNPVVHGQCFNCAAREHDSKIAHKSTESTGKTAPRARQYKARINQRVTVADKYPLSLDSLSWLSGLTGGATVNPA